MSENVKSQPPETRNRIFPKGSGSVGAPHPFPYQGSKRKQSQIILARFPGKVRTLYEPFAGSAAITNAAAHLDAADSFAINDLHKPLVDLWKAIIDRPDKLADKYEKLWTDQTDSPGEFYNQVRARFNSEHKPEDLLYLLARCVKAAIRYNSRGEFNNSPDKRRLGMRPQKMKSNLLAVSKVLHGRTTISSTDYAEAIANASEEDLVYMDPPYQGVTNTHNHRYVAGFSRDLFIETLRDLNARKVPYIVSYDGRTGDKVHGEPLPSCLGLRHEEVMLGPSTQGTLIGRPAETVESLYLSKSLVARIDIKPLRLRPTQSARNLFEASFAAK